MKCCECEYYITQIACSGCEGYDEFIKAEWLEEHDKHIRAEVFAEFLLKDCESCEMHMYDTIRSEVIEKVKKYIRLKTKYAEHSKDDYVLAHEMYDWLEEQLKEI